MNLYFKIKSYIFLSTKNYFTYKLFLILFIFNFINKVHKSEIFSKNSEENINIIKHFHKYYNNISNNFQYFELTRIKFYYSLKYGIIKVEYCIQFYDKQKDIILPSDLVLYNRTHVICNIKLIKLKMDINSLANIKDNNKFICSDFFNINEEINIGIIIYIIKGKNIEYIKYYALFSFNIRTNYKQKILFHKSDDIFDPLILNKKYLSILNEIKKNDKKKRRSLKLQRSYMKHPIYILKRKILFNHNKWNFINVYNYYYCSCAGNWCFFSKPSNSCKYYFYLHIIDKNKNVYGKTDYLFIDFIFNNYSSDDVYPVFKEMANLNLPVHYITENSNIYNKYCDKKYKCLTIIFVNKDNYIINGDFIEKYLTLFLKLKYVLSGGGINFNYINNIFFNIEYINYICVGHGVSFFKYFLYESFSCYGNNMYDKILIPPSEKLISVAKKHGWDDKNIIKLNLPRWDKYNMDNKTTLLNQKITNKYT